MESAAASTRDAAPVILEGPQDVSALVGDRVVLDVRFSGAPPPRVTWKRAGRELQGDERTSITSVDGQSRLLLERITADDSGKYDVVVANALGAAALFASVSVEGPPDPPSGVPQVASARGGVLVTWSSSPFDGGRQITGYRVEVAVAGSGGWRTACACCHSLHHVVEGLQPGARHAFRVRAANAHGVGAPSPESPAFLVDDGDAQPVRVEADDEAAFAARYATHEVIGKGRFGVVRRVVDAQTGQTFAAKIVRCRTHQDKAKVREEIAIMSQLRHAKLLQLAAAFEAAHEMVMVMEFVSGGELFERVVADDFTLTEQDCIVFVRQICEGVAHMHRQRVAHLDLKPENILCRTRDSHEIKIIDFGLARRLDPLRSVRVLFGTPEFIPPEIINYEPISVASDMWSVGVICYVLLSGLSPFLGDSDAETFANITRADYDFEDAAFAAVSQSARDFIHALLRKRKEDRMAAASALRHRWLDNAVPLCNVVIPTNKLKRFIIRRKWQKTGNAIRALGRMATLSASRRNSSGNPSMQTAANSDVDDGHVHRMDSLDEEDDEKRARRVARTRSCSEHSDSGISDCSALPAANSCTNTPLLGSKITRSQLVERSTCSNDLDALVNGKLQQWNCRTSIGLDKSTSMRSNAKQSVANQIQKFDQLDRLAADCKLPETIRPPIAATAMFPFVPNQLKQPKANYPNNQGTLEVASTPVESIKSKSEKPANQNEHFQKVSAFWNKYA